MSEREKQIETWMTSHSFGRYDEANIANTAYKLGIKKGAELADTYLSDVQVQACTKLGSVAKGARE